MIITFRWPWWLLLACTCLAVAASGYLRPLVVERIERLSVDWRQEQQAPPPAMADIVLVQAGERTFAELGAWPWSRDYHAALLGKIGRSQLILLDILFPEHSAPQPDQTLVAVVGSLGNVILASHLVSDNERIIPVPPFPELFDAALAVGVTNVSEDIDGLIRYYHPVWPGEDSAIPTFPLMAAAVLLNVAPSLEMDDSHATLRLGEREIPLDDQGRMLIRFTEDRYEVYEFVDVLTGDVRPEAFEGKIAIVGVAAAGLEDFHIVPDGLGKRVLPGAHFNADVLSTLLGAGVPLRLSPITSAIAAALLYSLGVLAALFRRPITGSLIGAGILLAFLAGNYLVFTTLNVWIDAVLPSASIVLGFTLTGFIKYTAVHRDWTLKVFSQHSLHGLEQKAANVSTFREYLDSIWPDIQLNTGVNLMAVEKPIDQLPTSIQELIASARPDPNERALTVFARTPDTVMPFKLVIPTTAGETDDVLITLLGWKKTLPEETVKTLATTVVSASWFFQALKRGQERKKMLTDTIQTIFRAVDKRDPITGGHSDRVANLSKEILSQMDLPQTVKDDIHLGALIHDIGKIGIPDSVLKKTGRLDYNEFSLIRNHPKIGEDIMAPVKLPALSREALEQHHERYDGSGYPAGLSGTDISLAARVVAVADVFDALLSDRPYRDGLPLTEVLEYIKRHSGSSFDPEIVEIFLSIKSPKDWQEIPKKGTGN